MTRRGKQAISQATGGGAGTLTPPGTGGQTPEIDLFQLVDSHVEADRAALKEALAINQQRDAVNRQQREQIMTRLRLLGEPVDDDENANGNANGAMVGRGRIGRPKGSKNKKASASKSAMKANGSDRGRRGEDTEAVLRALQKLGGKRTNAEVAKAVLKIKPNMTRRKIDSALQALRGRMVNGKQVGHARVRITGKPRDYRYEATV